MVQPDLATLDPTAFEAFAADLLRALGFTNVEWRKGTALSASPADGGRDIVAHLERTEIDGTRVTEHWFVECKHSRRGVPPQSLQSLLAAASAHRPDVALVIVSGFLSNPAKDYLKAYATENRPPFRVKYWERPQLLEFCRDHSDLVARHFPTAQDALSVADDLAGRLADAELAARLGEPEYEVLAEIISSAESAGLLHLALRARMASAGASNAAGDFSTTVALLEPVVGQFDPIVHTDAIIYLARAYTSLGTADQAVRVLEEALARLDTGGYTDPAIRVELQLLLSYSLSEAGDLERAREVVADATVASTADDPYSQVRLYWSTARILHAEGRAEESLAYLRRAMSTLDRNESTLHLARAHLLAGTISLRADRLDQATASIGAASTLLGLAATTADKAELALLSAQLELRAGDLEQAEQRAHQARQFAPDDLRLLVEVERLFAAIRRAEGRDVEALNHLDRAAQIVLEASASSHP